MSSIVPSEKNTKTHY